MNTVLAVIAAVLAWLCIVLLVLLIGRDRAARREEARLELKLRHAQGQAAGYRAEAMRLSAAAALTPDVEPPIPAGLLDDLHQLPTTSEREYPL